VNNSRKGQQAYLTIEQSRSQFSLWCILSAPLILSNDLRKLDSPENKWILDIITNNEVIAVNQDVRHVQGTLIKENMIGNITKDGNCTSNKCTRTEIWAKRITDNDNHFAVVLFNRAGLNANEPKFSAEKIEITWDMLGKFSSTQKMLVRDLWNRRNIGTYQGGFTSDAITQQDVVMITITPQ
jgi:alpha-galactosidase